MKALYVKESVKITVDRFKQGKSARRRYMLRRKKFRLEVLGAVCWLNSSYPSYDSRLPTVDEVIRELKLPDGIYHGKAKLALMWLVRRGYVAAATEEINGREKKLYKPTPSGSLSWRFRHWV